MAELTDNIYYASLDPRVLRLRSLGLGQGNWGVWQRYSAAIQLFLQGLLVDYDIMVIQYFGGPTQIMAERVRDGYTWTAALGYPELGVPVQYGGSGMNIPRIHDPAGSLIDYNPNKPWPKGAMIVSTDSADFPAWETTH